MEFPSHPTGKNIRPSQGATGLYRGIQSQARGPIQNCQGPPIVNCPIDDHQQGQCYGGLPVGAGGGGTRTFPHPGRRGHPPGKGR